MKKIANWGYFLILFIFICGTIFIYQYYKSLIGANSNIKKNELVTKEKIVQNETNLNDDKEEATKFCPNIGSIFYLNSDEDQEKELLVSCEPASSLGYMEIFILDKQGGEYHKIFSKDRRDIQEQRYYNFEKLKVDDINKDGIDEIIWEEAWWSMFGSSQILHIYSPKDKEYFERMDRYEVNQENGDYKLESTNFSENLLSEFQIFKNYLSTYKIN